MTQPNAPIKYFAYASNLNKQRMKENCSDAVPRFKAVLPNYRLFFTGWSREWHGGKAMIKPFRGEKVRGAIYEVTDACLRKLDRFEPGYVRINITVFDEDNEPHQAVTYIKTGQLDESMPSKEYAAIIKQGYRDWAIG
ncbi:MAG: gamma-glutamylcyclotransferase [Dehalococcoidales bacterium]|nr:gamma-glutamylcyclotransferase [Dehalococcoidales bacterium]